MLLLLALMVAAAQAPTAARNASNVAHEGTTRVAALLETRAVLRPSGPVSFLSKDKAVSNWRWETWRILQPSPLSAIAAALDMGRPVVTRCVRLNNYWCIKSARWNGELGADDEGHAGFDSAERAADAAAGLLRRYYLEFGRKSALDIVRRWAPAECRIATIGGGGPPMAVAVRGIGNTLRARWLAAHRRRRPGARVGARGSARSITSAASAAKPAARAQTPSVTRTARLSPGRVSAVPLRPLPAFRVPQIAVGVGERPARAALAAGLAPQPPAPRPPTRSVRSPALAENPVANRGRVIPGLNPEPSGPLLVEALIPRIRPSSVAVAPAGRAALMAGPSPTAFTPSPRMVALAPALAGSLAPAKPMLACAPDEERIRNYAARIAASVKLQPSDDLVLFDVEGRPLPHLAPVMLAMSGVELGLLRASADLVAGAIERLTQHQVAEAAQAGPAP